MHVGTWHHSVCDNVYCLLTMFSALAAVCTVYCAIGIVLITLHYITYIQIILLLVRVSFTIIGQPRNSVLIRRV